MKLLITGAQGFIGHILINQLSDAAKIQDFKLISYDDDLLNTLQLKKFINENGPFDTVIHLAGQFGNDIEQLLDNNVQSTLNLFEFLGGNYRNFIFTSTVGVYGNCLVPAVETQVITPNTLYALTKQMAENIVEYYSRLNLSSTHTILRLANVFGEGGKGVLDQFINSIKTKNQITISGTGKQVRDFVNVDDVVDVIKYFILNPHSGIFNVTNGIAYSLKDLESILRTKYNFTTVFTTDSNTLQNTTLSGNKLKEQTGLCNNRSVVDYINSH